MRRAKYEIAERTEAEWGEMPELAPISWWCKRVLEVSYTKIMRLVHNNEMQYKIIGGIYCAFKSDIKSFMNNNPLIALKSPGKQYIAEYQVRQGSDGHRISKMQLKWDDMPDYYTSSTLADYLCMSTENVRRWMLCCGLRHHIFNRTRICHKRDVMEFLKQKI